MKGLKIAAYVVGGLAVLTVITVAVALSSSFQTWAVRKAVAGQPGMKIGVSSVSAGLSAADVADFSFAQDGMVVTAKGVSARYSAWDYVSGGRVNVDSVDVSDLVIDLRKTPPAPGAASTPGATAAGTPPAKSPAGSAPASGPAAKPTPFDGLLHALKLPLEVRVGTLNAKGRALLPDDQTVVFDLKGSRIETGQSGKLEWTVDFSDSKVGAALRALRTTGTLSLRLTKDGRIDLVEIDGNAAAMGPKIPSDQFRLSVKAAQPAAGGNETYAVALGLVRGGQLESLFKTDATWTAAAREIAGTWDLGIRTEQLAALLAGLGLPEVAANSTGKFTVKPDTLAATASGSLTARISQLQKLSADLAPIGSVTVTTAFAGAHASDTARLDQLDLDVTAADGRKFAQIALVQKVSYGLKDARLTLADSKADAARVTVNALPLAWAQSFAKPMLIESGDLSLSLAVGAEPDGSRVRVRTLEPVALRNVTVRDDKKKALVEKLSLSVRPALDYSVTALNAKLADLVISLPTGDGVTGNLSADITDLKAKAPTVAFASTLAIKVVDAVKTYVGFDPGPLEIALVTEGRQDADTLTVTKSTATVSRAGGALVTAHELLQPLRVDLKTSKLSAAKPDAPVARLRLGDVPLAWAESFVPKSKLSGAVTGGTFEASLRSMDDVGLVTTAPFTLRGVTAVLDGQTLAQNLDIAASLDATKRGDAVTYDLKRFAVTQGETTLVTLLAAGTAKLGAKLAATAKGTLDADLPALGQQPMLASYATLSRGQLAATFDAALADATEAKATFALKNLVAKAGNQPLGALDLNVAATLKADGTGSFNLPLTLTAAGRKSDLTVTGTFGQTEKKTPLFAAKIASANLVVDDFQALAVLAPASPAPAPAAKPTAAPTPAPGTRTPTNVVRAPSTTQRVADTASALVGPAKRDTAPFWQGANGKVEVDLKRILYGKDYTISGVRGTAVVTDTRLALDGLEGRFKENPFKLAGGVTFNAAAPQPYTLAASADVKDFNVGEFLRAASPNEKPALETVATVSAKLAGNGVNLGNLGANAYGRFEVTGTKGLLRILARKGNAGTLVNVASLGLAILGASKGSDTTAALAELTTYLNEVSFETIKLQVERAPDLSFKLTSLEVLSPALRLTGSGAVASKSTDDLANAPMNIVLQLGAKDHLALLLSKTGQLGAKQDDKGYYLMSRTFQVGGTPTKPDNSALWKLLLEAGVGAFAR